jgi:tetratricopeptide (TPR) repeat protein
LSRSRLGSYRLTLRLGEGGTGVVYKATRIGGIGDFAIKRIRPGLVAEPRFVDSLLTEARICAHLDHPQIARLFELGQAGGEYFLVMEHVQGVSLKELLARLGAGERTMAAGLACHLAAQIAGALGYAHRRCDEQGRPLGIVHRDVNPSNVMVTTGGEVKLLDFGIASAAGHLVQAAGTSTRTGIIKGTLGYLSPEQAEGLPLDARTDLFSLGVVLYQCLTGKALFESANPLRSLQLLRESAFPPPGSALPGLDPELDGVLRRLLERDRERRYPSGEEAARALQPLARRLGGDGAGLRSLLADLPPRSERAPTPLAGFVGTRTFTSFWPRLRPLPRLALAAAAAGLLIGAIGIGRWGTQADPRVEPVPGEVAPRRWFALLGFRNRGPAESAWLSTALGAVVGSELDQAGRLRRLENEEVARTRADLEGRPENGGEVLSAETLARVRRQLKAELIVRGSYRATPDGSLQLELKAQETAAGRTVARATADGPEQDLFEVAARAAERLHQQLDRGAVPGAAAPRPSRATLPDNLEATRLYSEGLDRLRNGDPAAARDLLTRAAAADPGHALTHLAISRAWSLLGYAGRSQAEARRALALAGTLDPEQRLFVEARAHQANRELPEALAAYQKLVDLVPDNLEYALDLAEVQASEGQRPAALATLERLRTLPPPLREDPRIDLALAQHHRRDPTLSLPAALAARQKAQSRGAELLVAEAESAIAWAYRQSDRCEKAIQLARSAQQTFERAGQWSRVADSGNVVGACLNDQGDDAGALKVADENLAITERIGDREQAILMLSNGAYTLMRMGRPAEARARYRRALSHAREIDDQSEICELALGVAQTLAAETGPGRALSAMAEVLDQSRRHCPEDLLEVLVTAAEYHTEAGALEEARHLNEEALALARRRGSPALHVQALLQAVTHQQVAGHFQRAAEILAEARALVGRSGRPGASAPVELAAGRLALERGDLAAAEGEARRVLDGRAPGGRPDEIPTAAHLLLARIRLARRQADAAAREIGLALAAAPADLAPWRRVEIDLHRARIEAARGAGAAARKRLQAALRFCRTRGLGSQELQARLAGLEIGPPAPAEARALGTLAARRGFALVARQAGRLAASGGRLTASREGLRARR